MNEKSKKCVLVASVNYKRAADTIACLLSLERMNLGGVELRVVVCDNSPTETCGAISEMLSALTNWSIDSTTRSPVFSSNSKDIKIAVFDSEENKGFAGGNNICANVGRELFGSFDYLWLLNNDTEVDAGCLESMLDTFQSDDRIGVCGSTMIYHYDRTTVQALGGSTYEPWSGTMREIGNGLQWPSSINERDINSRMSYVCGASMLVSARFVRDVGLMDEDYFLFFEEIDWCERGRRKGYKFAYASGAIVYHKEGAAIGTGTGVRRSLLAEYYGMRNKLLITRRFFPWALPTVWLIGWLQVARRALQRRPANAWLMAKVLCGLGKRPL